VIVYICAGIKQGVRFGVGRVCVQDRLCETKGSDLILGLIVRNWKSVYMEN
jgi:hypothetical protein